MTAPEVLTLDDESRWRELLPARESVFGSVEFARIQRRHTGVEPRLFTLRSRAATIAHVLHLRALAELPLAASFEAARFDAVTPPYTGPFGSAAATDGDRRAFGSALDAWCAETAIVSEFGHLHPWKARTELLDASSLEHDREIVYVDLTLDEERLWRDSLTHACRKNIRRARREGVRVLEATTAEHARELHRIYELTMNRRGAVHRYRLPPEYFASFLELLPDNARIVLAEHEGRVIAATLYLHDESDAYSYLGGADHDYQRLRPTNAVVHEMICWGRERGIQRLVLGGGYAPDDGILRFKASFSPLRRPFYVYRRVHLPDAYATLTERWRTRHHAREAPDFFPPYRAIPAQPR